MTTGGVERAWGRASIHRSRSEFLASTIRGTTHRGESERFSEEPQNTLAPTSLPQNGVFPLKNTAPANLSAEAKDWWRRLVKEYDLADDGGRLILQTTLEAFDRMRGCQKAIKKDGEILCDRFMQVKPHPLLATERDARAQMLAGLKALNLDVEPLRDRPGRPGGL